METVIISARFKKKKKTEFYQTIESLKPSIKNYCKDFEMKMLKGNNFEIRVTFTAMGQFENNFYNPEFVILKGSILSLCHNVSIKLNDINLN